MKTFGGRDVPQYLAPYAAYLSSTPYGSKILNKGVGYLARIAGLLFVAWGQEFYRPSHLALLSSGDKTLSLSAGVGLSVVGAVLFMSARNFLARGALTGLAQDHRSPVVYLRSFKSDVRLFETPSQVLALLIGHASQTYEWSLAKATAAIGPLVAIGQPGEKLPPGGAARLYVDNDHWQQVATELVSIAKLVVLRVGQTRGFLWELRHVVEQCDPRKVVVFLPATDRGALYGYLREQAAEILPSPLPPDPGNAPFLAFGPGWEPRFIGAPANPFFGLCRRLFRSPSGVLRDALVSIAGEDREFVRKTAMRKSIPLLCLCYLVSNVIAYADFASINTTFDARLFFLFISNNDPQFYFATFLFGYFIFAVVSVLLFQRFGPRRWITGMMLAASVLCAATYVSSDMIYLLIIRFLLGAALAGLIPATASYVAALVPAGHRARWIGLVMLAIPLASLPTRLAPFLGTVMATELPAPGMIHAALMRGLFGGAAPHYARIPALTDWQGFYLLLGIFAVSLAIGAMLCVRDEFTDASSSAAEAARLDPDQPAESMPGPARGASRSNLPLLALSIVWPSLIAIAASLAWTGSELTVGLNLPLPDSLYLLWLSPFGFALCMMMWAWHADRTGERKSHAIAPLLIAVFGVWTAAIANSTATKAWAGIATGVGMFAVVPMLWTSAVELAMSTSLAVQIATIVAVGTMLETIFWVFELRLFGTGPIAISSLGLIAAVVFAIIYRPHRIISR
jgi:hypothetical protein